MRIEDEIEWNSHIIKSGRVFGTYDWMISKGYNLEEINYVVFDTVDDTWEPLAKAVGKATQQHPDILLKNAMRDALQQDQATRFQTRMQAGRDAGLDPKPTGAEYMQANKPFSAAYAGFKNLMSGGAHSRGDVPEPEAPEGQQERFGVLSALRRPGVALGSALQARSAKSNYGRLSQKIANNEFAMQRLLAGREPDDLSPGELERYNRMKDLVEDAEKERGGIDTRGYQERAKEQANARFAQKRPNAAPGDAPFPEAASQKLQNPEEAEPLDDEEAPPEAQAAVEEVNANEAERQANKETPPQEVGKPQASEASEIDTSDPKAFSQALGYARFKPEGKAGDLFRRLTEAKGKGSPIAQTIERARIGMGRGSRLTQEMFNDVMTQFGFTPELFAQLPDEQQKEVIETVREEVEKPAEETPAEPAEPAEPVEPSDDDIDDFDDFEDDEGMADIDDDEIDDFTFDDDKPKDPDDDVITSSDTLESLNMAWTFLKHRV